MLRLDDNKIAEIDAAVRKVLADAFRRTRILEVRAREDVGSDGEELLRLEVIFKGPLKKVDVDKLTGITRLIRPELAAIGITAFPLFYVISEQDLKMTEHAAA